MLIVYDAIIDVIRPLIVRQLLLDPRYVKNNGRKQLDLPEKQNSLLEAGLE